MGAGGKASACHRNGFDVVVQESEHGLALYLKRAKRAPHDLEERSPLGALRQFTPSRKGCLNDISLTLFAVIHRRHNYHAVGSFSVPPIFDPNFSHA
jgi:hypothetical protein